MATPAEKPATIVDSSGAIVDFAPGVTLHDVDRARLTALLGEPVLVRRDGNAEYRRYRLADCMLDVFLYTRHGTDTARVEHADVRPLSEGNPIAGPCKALDQRLGVKESSGNPPG